jgi:hypothetical protein
LDHRLAIAEPLGRTAANARIAFLQDATSL